MFGKNQAGMQPAATATRPRVVPTGNETRQRIVPTKNKWKEKLGMGLQSMGNAFSAGDGMDEEVMKPQFSMAERYRTRLGLPRSTRYEPY